jgi:putative membrane protein
MMYDDAGWGWWVMGVVVLVVVVIVVAVASAVVLAARPRPSHVAPPSEPGRPAPEAWAQPSSAALEALDLRFARGEVDEETYRRTRDLLARPPGR